MSGFGEPVTTPSEWESRTSPSRPLATSCSSDCPKSVTELSAGEAFGEVESTKSVSDLYAPVSAKVVAVNQDLDGTPELVNSEPYGGGWLIDLQVDGEALEKGFGELLDAEAYRGSLAE